jgi:hypothetical protein
MVGGPVKRPAQAGGMLLLFQKTGGTPMGSDRPAPTASYSCVLDGRPVAGVLST